MKLNENEMNKVAGGTVVKTEKGDYILMPPGAPRYNSEAEANKADEEFSKNGPPQNGGEGQRGGRGNSGFRPPMMGNNQNQMMGGQRGQGNMGSGEGPSFGGPGFGGSEGQGPSQQ